VEFKGREADPRCWAAHARKYGMISLQDCLALCDLTPDEVAAIGEHEHVPEIIAASLGSYLIHRAQGAERVREMIVDDIRSSVRRHDISHARYLVSVLRTFLHEHPDAAFKHRDMS
jgi:hypothetical protein